MDSQQITNWVQVVPGVALLVGIGLVVWELQQNREAFQSQLTSDAFHNMSQRNITLLGEQPTKVLAKACDAPDSLTRAELRILKAFYMEHLNSLRRLYVIAGRGGYYDVEYWKRYPSDITVIFETEVGKSFWRTMTGWLEPDVKRFGDELLAAGDFTSCTKKYDAWVSDFTTLAE